jgi:uncharacterized protein YdaU (DUF1376 family)
MKRPWMPLYIADYLKDTTHLGAIESGAYLHLIMDYWQSGKLPTEDRLLARIAKLTDREWKKLRPVLQSFFHDGWKHKRIDEELAHTQDISSKRSAVASARQAAIREQSECKDSAIAPTLHTSHFTEEESGGAEAPAEMVVPIRRYAYEGRTIRLEQKAFDRWKKSYHAIPDFTAALQSADDYYSETPPKDGKWFFPVSRWLEKQHTQEIERQEAVKMTGRSF